jgi:hypothetical protein
MELKEIATNKNIAVAVTTRDMSFHERNGRDTSL